jgi:hypothetical protein
MQLNRAIFTAMAASLAATLTLGAARTATGDDEGRARRVEGEPAVAQDTPAGGCSNRTLRGDYGFTIDGQILTPGGPLLLRGLAMTHFDGRGNLSQIDFTTLNGVPRGTEWRPGTGTYELEHDCTGTAVIEQSDGSPTLHLRLIVIDGGRQVHTVVEGNPTGSVGTKVR